MSIENAKHYTSYNAGTLLSHELPVEKHWPQTKRNLTYVKRFKIYLFGGLRNFFTFPCRLLFCAERIHHHLMRLTRRWVSPLHIAWTQQVGRRVSAIGSQIAVLLTCGLVQIYEEGHRPGITQWAAASGVIDLLLDTCHGEWKLEFGEGSTVAWVQGRACWQLKLGPTSTQPSQAVWPERFMDPKERVGPTLLKGGHTLWDCDCQITCWGFSSGPKTSRLHL